MIEDVGEIGCVVVYTCRGKDRILREGGSQAWRIDMSRASKRKFLVCVQNRNETWGQATADHQSAFLIAKISRIEKSTEKGSADRAIIKISEYAELSFPDAWDGNRNPVAYKHLRDFGIHTFEDLEESLSWTRLGAQINFGDIEPAEMPGDDYVAAEVSSPSAGNNVGYEEPKALTVDEAKIGLARKFGVSIDQIEITIRW
ncbi:hypothetical protein [Pseudomonas syringae]|uniref:hypothetical protein n=1 Tax=Pseudomonas syringae TaxID=317 RepID=UPI000E30B484|nr:hypothetical protein [Pseudomonas syringae]